MLTNFSNYVDFDKAMTIYSFICKLTNFGKNIIYIISPNSFQYLGNDQDTYDMIQQRKIWYNFKDYINMYVNPSNKIPPYKGSNVI